MQIDSKANNLIAILPNRHSVIARFGHEEDARALVYFVGDSNKACDVARKLIEKLSKRIDLTEAEWTEIAKVKDTLQRVLDAKFTWAQELT